MKYSIISNEKRAVLIRRVVKQNQPVRLVADQLKIKFPSAKSIIRTYKKTGRTFNKKKTRKYNFQSLDQIQSHRGQRNKNEVKKQDDIQIQVIQRPEQKKQMPIQSQNSLPTMSNLCQPIQAYSFVSTFIYSPYVQYPNLTFNLNQYSS